MSRFSHYLSTHHGRTLALLFVALLAMLSYFSLTAASAEGGVGIYVVTTIQMLVLAAIVAIYSYAVVFLDEGEQATD
jgi:hypothetical protein